MLWAGSAASGQHAGDAVPAPVAAGRRMYREGLLPSGQPLTATVQGDVPVLGSQFSCQSCHGRSGMGAGEGALRVPPIAAPLLLAPDPQNGRPAYEETTLAGALRQGRDAAGRVLDPLMPRYAVTDADVAALFAYLRTLSAQPSPGVDEVSIRFATVFAPDIPSGAREAVLDVLRTYVNEKNRETRKERIRPEHGVPSGQSRPRSYRTWELEAWDLAGPPESWRTQLEERYRERPVFALLGGVTTGSWSPVHEFCEERGIPGLFPSTDLPGDGSGDFYTLYFSRGLFLEADLIASDVARSNAARVVQAYRKGAPGEQAAAALRERLRSRGIPVEDQALEGGAPASLEGVARRIREGPGWAGALWLAADDLGALASLRDAASGALYLSATLLDRRLDGLPGMGRGTVRVAHPYRLPGQADPGLQRFRLWSRARRIQPRHERLQAQAFFACLAAADALMHLGRYFYRDYLLDLMDHAQGLTGYLPLHPAPSVGPGQRFVTKGGYLVTLGADGRADVAAAEWRVP